MIELQSAQSLRISLESIRRGEGGLDEHRAAMLRRVPEAGDWAKFPHGHLSMKDLAYLTAKTSHDLKRVIAKLNFYTAQAGYQAAGRLPNHPQDISILFGCDWLHLARMRMTEEYQSF